MPPSARPNRFELPLPLDTDIVDPATDAFMSTVTSSAAAP
jgi:hypothetical protein